MLRPLDTYSPLVFVPLRNKVQSVQSERHSDRVAEQPKDLYDGVLTRSSTFVIAFDRRR